MVELRTFFFPPMRGLGSGHVTCGPMRGLKKNGKKINKKIGRVEYIFFLSTNERPWIWSCDLWANERPKKNGKKKEKKKKKKKWSS